MTSRELIRTVWGSATRTLHHSRTRRRGHLGHLVGGLALALTLSIVLTAAAPRTRQFRFRTEGEAVATVFARCDKCAWEVEGREAAVFRVLLDGRYIQHLPLVRPGRADYKLLLGAVSRGMHQLSFEEDTELTARDLRGGQATIERIDVEQLTPLRLGVASPEVALIQLRSRGIVLRGLAGAWAGERRPDGAVLRALPPQKIRLASLPAAQPRSA